MSLLNQNKFTSLEGNRGSFSQFITKAQKIVWLNIFNWLKFDAFSVMDISAFNNFLPIYLTPLPGTAGGRPCVFPFKFEDVEYNACTYEKSERLWCATQVDDDGVMVPNM